MRAIIFLLTLCTSLSFSQPIDNNLKRGFAANGYDVVAYFKNTPLEGSKKFITEYNGAKYKFSSSENLNTFKNNPEKYLPQYGGYCTYAIALKASKVSINPKTFKIINERLYLFYNAWGTNTLDLWQKENERELLEKADKNWSSIKFKK